MLGRKINDCLPATTTTTAATEHDDGNNDNGAVDNAETPEDVQIEEGLDGAVLIRNMLMHTVKDA